MKRVVEEQKAAPNAQTIDAERCYQCNERLGLIRYLVAETQLCSAECLNKFQEAAYKMSLIKQWRDFYAQKR
jgi:hypothetical protein